VGCVAGRRLRGGGGGGLPFRSRRCCNDPPTDGGGGGGLGGRPGWKSVHDSLGGGKEVRRYADDAPEGGVGASGGAAGPAELGNMRSCDSGSGQISDSSSTDERRSSRRKSFLSSVVTDGFTTRSSMKTAFAERAGTWWRGSTCTGGRWEAPSWPADPPRALAYEKDVDVAIFAKNSAKSNDDGECRLCWRKKFGQGVRSCEEMYTTTC
jgi:hypothetical protein